MKRLYQHRWITSSAGLAKSAMPQRRSHADGEDTGHITASCILSSATARGIWSVSHKGRRRLSPLLFTLPLPSPGVVPRNTNHTHHKVDATPYEQQKVRGIPHHEERPDTHGPNPGGRPAVSAIGISLSVAHFAKLDWLATVGRGHDRIINPCFHLPTVIGPDRYVAVPPIAETIDAHRPSPLTAPHGGHGRALRGSALYDAGARIEAHQSFGDQIQDGYCDGKSERHRKLRHASPEWPTPFVRGDLLAPSILKLFRIHLG